MKWYQWLFCILIMLITPFIVIDGYKLLTAKSNTYGYYVYIPNTQSTFFNEKLTGVALTSQDDVSYVWSKTFDKVDFNGLLSDYEILINDNPCYFNKVYAGKIESVFKLDYRDVENNILTTSSLDISISFLDSGVVLNLSLINDNDNLIFFEEYINNNGLDFKVVENI